MDRSTKIIITGTLILMLFAMVLLLLNARELTLSKKGLNDIILEVSKKEMRTEYEADIKNVTAEMEEALQSEQVPLSEVEEMKQKMFDMRVPGDYRDLHIQIVLAIDRLALFAADGEAASKAESRRMMDEVALKYKWIKDN